MSLEPKRKSTIAGGKFLLIVVTFVYSMTGIIYYGWSIFFIVYLFWFENFIRIFFLKLKTKSALAMGAMAAPTQKMTNEKGEDITSVSTVIKARLFFSFLYFIFIIVGLGFVIPFMMDDDKQSIQSIISSVSIIFFKDWEFNVALMICIVKELTDYFANFKLEPKYSSKNPFPFPKMLDKDDYALHLTIIFGVGITMLSKHPVVSGIFSFIDQKWIYIYPGIFLVLMKFIFSLYNYYKSAKSERSVEEDEIAEIL